MEDNCQLLFQSLVHFEFSRLLLCFLVPNNKIVSNVTAQPSENPENIKNLLIEQIEKPVRWRESIINMINHGNKKFIEIGPGKVLSGLVKRIDRNIELYQVNNIEDLNNLDNL